MILFCEGNVPSSKNGRQWTGKYFIASKATNRWRKDTKWWWKENKDKFVEKTKDKNLPLRIGMHFVRGSKHKYDWLNPAQTIQDEMVTYGWMEDDNTSIIVPVPFKVNGVNSSYNKEKPGVYIKIY